MTPTLYTYKTIQRRKGLIFFLKKFCYLFDCVMICGLQRPDSRAENLADFLILHVLKVFHLKHQALFLRQTGYDFLQLGLQLVSVKKLIAHQEVNHTGVFIQTKMIFLLLHKIQRLIDGDADKARWKSWNRRERIPDWSTP